MRTFSALYALKLACAEHAARGTIAIKHDQNKPTFDLLPHIALAEVQKVLDFGAQKYDAWNWYKGMGWLRLWNACLRHLFAWVRGCDRDEESGLPHLAHAACCLLFLLTYSKENLGTDDRRKTTTHNTNKAKDRLTNNG